MLPSVAVDDASGRRIHVDAEHLAVPLQGCDGIDEPIFAMAKAGADRLAARGGARCTQSRDLRHDAPGRHFVPDFGLVEAAGPSLRHGRLFVRTRRGEG